MSRFYCTNAHCTARQYCKNATTPYTADKVVIQGQGMHDADCPDLVMVDADEVMQQTGGIF
jgi:hypothetical protein